MSRSGVAPQRSVPRSLSCTSSAYTVEIAEPRGPRGFGEAALAREPRFGVSIPNGADERRRPTRGRRARPRETGGGTGSGDSCRPCEGPSSTSPGLSARLLRNTRTRRGERAGVRDPRRLPAAFASPPRVLSSLRLHRSRLSPVRLARPSPPKERERDQLSPFLMHLDQAVFRPPPPPRFPCILVLALSPSYPFATHAPASPPRSRSAWCSRSLSRPFSVSRGCRVRPSIRVQPR